MQKLELNPSALAFIVLAFLASTSPGQGRSSVPAEENVAVILGQTGEQYPIYGTGGIKVTGGHHGMWSSNMKHSTIEIDGSGVTPRLAVANMAADFTASVGTAHSVSHSCVCILPPANASAGQEVVVCNAKAGTTITYHTTGDDALFASNQSGSTENSAIGKVDRFISDGTNWYRE